MIQRTGGRGPAEIRATRIRRGYLRHAEGSVMIEVGETRVICSATVDDKVPPFRRESSGGWLTAEYGMIPRSSAVRIRREVGARGVQGRTFEIQRLIGRSLRAVTDLAALGPRTIQIDCDVIQADGGTRTAAISGAYVALADAIDLLRRQGVLPASPLLDSVAAVSVGIVGGEAILDLDYGEDVTADVDMNVVMTGSGRYVEVQGTAEGKPFGEAELESMLTLAAGGIARLTELQKAALAEGKAP